MIQSLLIRFFLFSLPLALVFGAAEYLARNEENTFTTKKRFIEEHGEEVEVLILGPSHMARAINPEYLDFKTAYLAHPGSSINIDHMVFEEFNKQLPNLKYVIWGHPLGYLERYRTTDWHHSALFYHFYGMEELAPAYQDRFLMASHTSYFTSKILRKYIIGGTEPFNQWGFRTPVPKRKYLVSTDMEGPDQSEVRKVLKMHNGIDDEGHSKNGLLLMDLLDQCEQRDITVIFVSTPTTKWYSEGINKAHEKRRAAFFDSIKGVHFWNYERSYEDNLEYFLDYDHMNPDGAKVLTLEINERLKNLDQNRNLP